MGNIGYLYLHGRANVKRISLYSPKMVIGDTDICR